MSLENTIDSIESVDEKYRSLYTENDGKFELDENLRKPDTTALLNAKNSEKKARQTAEARAAALLVEKEELEIKKAELEGNKAEADRLRQDALDRQKKAHADHTKSLEKQIYDMTVGSAINSVAAAVYRDPDVIKLDFLNNRIKLAEGNTVTYLDRDGATMTKEDLIVELRADKNMAAYTKAGEGQGGGGGNNAGDTSGGAPMSKSAKMEQKKAALMRANPNLRLK